MYLASNEQGSRFGYVHATELDSPLGTRFCPMPSSPGLGEPSREVAVWAENIDAVGRVCEDARLNAGSSKETFPSGSSKGQAGWDVGINYSNLRNLAEQLWKLDVPKYVCGNWWQSCGRVQRGQIGRLAIAAHGLPGEFQINRKGGPLLTAESIKKDKAVRSALTTIEYGLSRDAVVLLVGCRAGAGPKGSALLKELSKIWPNRTIVGFTTTMAFGWGRSRVGEYCQEPGYRDTDKKMECGGTSSEVIEGCERNRYSKVWDNLTRLPWASQYSPHAKVAKNGKIVKKG